MPVSPWLRKRVTPVADKLVYASNAYVTLKSAVNSMSGSLIRFDGPPAGEADRALLSALEHIVPVTGNWADSGREIELVRIGADHDGGYVMADDFNVGGAISIGVGPDVTWDQAIAAKGIPVAMFDPTIRRPPALVPAAKFFRLGLGSHHQPRMEPLAELVHRGSNQTDQDLLLKVDVEGAEYEGIGEASQDLLGRFRQVVVELHGLSKLQDPSKRNRILGMLGKLNKTHASVHVHANNYDEVCLFDSYWFANAIEVTYVRRDLLKNTHHVDRIHSECDRPCDPRVSEISLEGLLTIDSLKWGMQ